jgi:hypothetical protein
MNGTTGGTITVGTRLSFDRGLWEVTELTATAVVLRDALGGLRQVSISGLLADPATRLLDTAAAEMISVSRILRWHECAWDPAQPSANAMFGVGDKALWQCAEGGRTSWPEHEPPAATNPDGLARR